MEREQEKRESFAMREREREKLRREKVGTI